MRTIKNDKHGVLYIIVTIAWTWGVLAVPIMLGIDFGNIVTKIAYAFAGAAPSAIALIFIFCSGDREYKYSFLKRIVRLGPIGIKGLAAIFMTVPAITILAAYINFFFTSMLPDWSAMYGYLNAPVRFITLAAFTLVFGPLAEEIGWRGYLLDRLKNRGILVSGLGIGLIWTLWHLPMFFIAGTYQNALLELGMMPVLCFAMSTIALSVIIGEIAQRYNSILSAILFHFMINFTGELIPLELTAEMIKTAFFAVIAFGIICIHMKKSV